MLSLTLDILLKVAGFIKAKRKFVLFLGLIGATLIFIYYPIIFKSSYIKITGIIFRFELPSSFKECEIYLKDEIIIDPAGTSIYPFSKNDNKQFQGKSLEIETKIGHLVIKNPFKEGASANSEIDSFHIYLKHRAKEAIKITKVVVDKKVINLKTFYHDNIIDKTNRALVEKQYITDVISLLLLNYNLSASNFILTFLLLCFFILLLELASKCITYYFLPPKSFAKYVNCKFSDNGSMIAIQDPGKRIEYYKRFYEQDIWYRFLQILGPTVGFLLTTSSLVAALNPSLQESRDIKSFFDSIQVAMISTFVGLLIRLIALFLQKISNKIFNRIDNLLFEYQGNE